MAESQNPTPDTEVHSTNGVAARKPSEQALQVVDVAVGAVPQGADAVTKTVEQLRDPEQRSQELQSLQNRVNNLRDSSTRDAQIETLKQNISDEIEKAQARGGDIRRQVTDQIVEQARKAREQLEPVYRERVEPVYKERVEPTVKKVRERV
jgi:cation transport regulator ChaC